MSSPGFTNGNSPVGYSHGSAANGGAASPYQNGEAGLAEAISPGWLALAC